jgi:hypothetical protein
MEERGRVKIEAATKKPKAHMAKLDSLVAMYHGSIVACKYESAVLLSWSNYVSNHLSYFRCSNNNSRYNQ